MRQQASAAACRHQRKKPQSMVERRKKNNPKPQVSGKIKESFDSFAEGTSDNTKEG